MGNRSTRQQNNHQQESAKGNSNDHGVCEACAPFNDLDPTSLYYDLELSHTAQLATRIGSSPTQQPQTPHIKLRALSKKVRDPYQSGNEKGR